MSTRWPLAGRQEEIALILQSVADGPVDGMTVRRLYEASAGNALMLRELVTAGLRAGALRR
jgi:hypothetical protein